MADDLKPNKKNLRERSDYGVRVARPGYDANNCAQNQLLFNSGWPILQLVKVIDMTGDPEYRYILKKDITKINNVTYDITETSETEYVDEIPSGWTNSYDTEHIVSSFRSVSVNRIHIIKDVPGTETVYSYPVDYKTEGDYTIITYTYCNRVPFIKKTHRLYYTPFFLESEAVSNIEGYVLLFSVDITDDVDYPYTEGALSIVGSVGNYGINSSSIFGSKVPGLCSNMFSKLVQAVKTQRTSYGNYPAIWSPVSNENEAKDGCLLPYEFYSFVSDFSGSVEDGGDYYYRERPWYIQKSNSGGFIDMSEAWAVATGVEVVGKNSLVVLRSPMVSPEYEEVVV